jgi:nitric oxide reductase NorQ protein
MAWRLKRPLVTVACHEELSAGDLGFGLDEGASTRMLVHAALLVVQGLAITKACRLAIVDALSDDADVDAALGCALDAAF